MLSEVDDGIAVTGQHGRGSVRVRTATRPWDDEILEFRCELTDAGVVAAGWVPTMNGDGLGSWAAELAESYGGWDGVRTWESVEHDLRIDATHDGRGHVSLRFVLRGPRGYEPDAWEAAVTVTLDAGEDMVRLAAELAAFLS